MSVDTDSPPQYEEWTAGALTAFCDHLVQKNYFAKETASSYKTAVTRVMEKAEGPDWESFVLKDADLELLFTRFMNAARSDFSAGTLRAYKNRFEKALSEYGSWVAAPDEYSPSIKRRTGPQGGRAESKNAEKAPTERASRQTSKSDPHSRSGLIEYPFPLRRGILAFLKLPEDLRQPEAERIARHVESLAIPEPPAADSEAPSHEPAA